MPTISQLFPCLDTTDNDNGCGMSGLGKKDASTFFALNMLGLVYVNSQILMMLQLMVLHSAIKII
jgi:hypothetical protein